MELYEARKSSAALVGIIKEVAPTNQAKNDTVLGVQAFEQDYFKGGDLYLDEAKAFYEYLGNRKLFKVQSVLGALVNPFSFYQRLKSIQDRLKAKNVKGNLVGVIMSGDLRIFRLLRREKATYRGESLL